MKRIFFVLALCCAPLPALAHKVIASVYASGDQIEGEVGFSTGEMASDTLVVVIGPDGEELGTTKTDAEGFFTYTPTAPVTHVFRADLGAGHVGETVMEAEDVARIMGVSVSGTASDTAATPAPGAVTGASAALSEQQRQAIAEALRDEIRPLRREISAYREHNDFQTILGGIGYIIGLFGLGFYLVARRKLSS